MAFGSFLKSGEEYKLVVLVRKDIKMGVGKVAAQVGHAAVDCALYAEKKDKRSFEAWYNCGQAKVVLKVDNLDELKRYMQMARGEGLTTSMITDAGRTQIEPGTITCLGIGPGPVSAIDKITGDLKML